MPTTAHVTWTGPGLRMVGKVPNGNAVVLDHVLAGEDREETGLRPLQLMLIGMAGCSAMDVVSILQKKREQLTDLRINIEAARASEHPRIYTEIHLEFVVKGKGVDPKAVARSIDLSVTKYCAGIAMIEKTAQITTSYRIEES